MNLTTESCHGASTPADDACYLDTAKDVATADAAVMTRGRAAGTRWTST